MKLEPREYDVIAHALGLGGTYDRFKPRRRWAYRNYFAAGGKDVETWRGLVDRGLACTLRPVDPRNASPGFAVTHEGAVAAGLRNYVPAKIIARPNLSK
jgi:hypothetical protein